MIWSLGQTLNVLGCAFAVVFIPSALLYGVGCLVFRLVNKLKRVKK